MLHLHHRVRVADRGDNPSSVYQNPPHACCALGCAQEESLAEKTAALEASQAKLEAAQQQLEAERQWLTEQQRTLSSDQATLAAWRSDQVGLAHQLFVKKSALVQTGSC